MQSNLPTPEIAGPGRQPAPAAPALISTTPAPSMHLQPLHLEKSSGGTRHGRLRILWYRLRRTIGEMNYATRRLFELQTRLP
jgi:hypothetical protein